MSGLFVYCLLNTDDWTDGGEALHSRLALLPGVESASGPEVVASGRLGAVVSRVPLDEFAGPELEENLEDMAWLEPRVRAHASVIEAAFTVQPVLPLRFGTLFSSADRIWEDLNPRQDPLLQELASVRGKEEWTIRFCTNPEAVMQDSARQALAASDVGGAGAKYLLQRKLAITGLPAMNEQLLSKAQQGEEALAQHALQVTNARTELSGVTGNRRSLLSRVFLIEQHRRPSFMAELDRVSELLAREGFLVLFSGPWPPSPPTSSA